MDFNIKNLHAIDVGGVEVWITETIVNTWIIMAVLIAFAVIVRIKLMSFKEIPTKMQNVVELMIETFDKFVKSCTGERLMFLGHWYFTIFAFVLLSNISGLARLRPPTADWTFTVMIALVTFVLIQVMGIRYRKGKFFKDLCEPNIIFMPLNVVGELARPVSLSFRLFGNILSGTILISLLYGIAPWFVKFGIPVVLHFYFDLFAGALQTYVFCILSLSFITLSAETN